MTLAHSNVTPCSALSLAVCATPQATNSYGNGYDKLSLDERVKYAQVNMPAMLAAAKDPLCDAAEWWLRGEKPWQLMACCLEIAAAVNSGNPATYRSRLPVHQDGSCNGLQHYAALARDRNGAKAVNLLPSELPQDVYSTVRTVVEEWVSRDAAAGRSEAVKLLARNGGTVDRKLVKQTVMTSVYGVTMVGARGQISNRLFERGWSNEAEVFQVASYLAKVTMGSVGQVFANAKGVMDWLAAFASTATQDGQPVTWRSPMGFPIMQPYFKDTRQSVSGKQGVHRSCSAFEWRLLAQDMYVQYDTHAHHTAGPHWVAVIQPVQR